MHELCYCQLQQVLASKDSTMTLWREQLPSSAHQQTSSAALDLREKVFILESCLSSLIFIPCQNQTQQSSLFGQMEAKAVILYSFILLIFWVLFSLTCPQKAHFIFPIPKFPYLKFSFVWQLWHHKVTLIHFLQLLLSVTSIQYICSIFKEKYSFSAFSALPCATTDDSSADKIKICITHWLC